MKYKKENKSNRKSWQKVNNMKSFVSTYNKMKFVIENRTRLGNSSHDKEC